MGVLHLVHGGPSLPKHVPKLRGRCCLLQPGLGPQFLDSRSNRLLSDVCHSEDSLQGRSGAAG